MAKSRTIVSKTSPGRKDWSDLPVPFLDMSHAASNYVSYNQADLSKATFYRAALSLCEFHGTNMIGTSLEQAIVICSSFSNETMLADETHQADVKGCLFLLSTCRQEKITRDWLKNKGAKNTDDAITNIKELSEIVASSKMESAVAEHYMKKITDVYTLLHTVKMRKDDHLFIDGSVVPILLHSTQGNFNTLKEAATCLSTYIEAEQTKKMANAFK